MIKKVLAALLAFVMILSLAAFGGALATETPPEPGEPALVESIVEEPDAEDGDINHIALIFFLLPVAITLVGGTVLYILKRRRGENVTFFN